MNLICIAYTKIIMSRESALHGKDPWINSLLPGDSCSSWIIGILGAQFPALGFTEFYVIHCGVRPSNLQEAMFALQLISNMYVGWEEMRQISLMNELKKFVWMHELNMLQFVIAVRIIVQWTRIGLLPIG